MSRMKKRKKRIRTALGAAIAVIIVVGVVAVGVNKNKSTPTIINNKEAAQKKENVATTNATATANTNVASTSSNSNVVQTSTSTKSITKPKQTIIEKKAVSNVVTSKKAVQNQPAQQVNQTTVQNLSEAELNYFTSYFNDASNNGFLLCSYSKPQQLDLNEVLYNGAGVLGATNVQNTEERNEYLKKSGNAEIFGDLIKLTSQQINNLLEQKANVKLSSVTTKFNWTYLNNYDAYYTQHGDTNYTKFICTGGYKKADGTYVINCKNAQDGLAAVYACTVTLSKEGNSYKFIANTITK